MKFVVIIGLVYCLAAVKASSISKKLTPEEKAKVKEFKTECLAVSGVSEDVVKKARHEGVFEDEAKLGKFFACFGKKTGFFNEAGEFQIDTIRSRITSFYNAQVADMVIEECTKGKAGSIEETALNFAKCSYRLKQKVQM